MHAFILPITVPTKTTTSTITINKIPNITMNLESNTIPKINTQHLKSKYNNQQTLTNSIMLSHSYTPPPFSSSKLVCCNSREGICITIQLSCPVYNSKLTWL